MIRKPTLEEWFLIHQLKAVAKRHFHVPIALSVDVTATVGAYRQRGERPPFTALVVKALAELAKDHPHVNRMVFHTLLGLRIVEFEAIHVNVPVLLEHAGRQHLSVVSIAHADRLSVPEIAAQIRAARQRKLADMPIGKLFLDGRNTLLRRLKLRLLHFLVFRFPRLFTGKGGGGLSVSSLLQSGPTDLAYSAPSFGPTPFTVCVTSVEEQPAGRALLHLGIGYDHFAFPGHEAAGLVARFAELMKTIGLHEGAAAEVGGGSQRVASAPPSPGPGEEVRA